MSSHMDAQKCFPIKFHNASTLIGLNSGIAELDNLVGFIPKGKVVFIKGTQSRKHFLELFCLRAITRYHNYCIFIDGGNSFDPYLLSRLATISKENPKEVLSRVIISRAFTCHQLASLIIKEAEKIVERFSTNFVAVSEILNLFTDPESEVDDYEIEIILPKVLRHIGNLASQNNAIAIITSDDSNEWLNRMLASYSEIVLTVNDDKEIIHVSLDKHHSNQKNSTELMLKHKPKIEKAETIEPWLMVDG